MVPARLMPDRSLIFLLLQICFNCLIMLVSGAVVWSYASRRKVLMRDGIHILVASIILIAAAYAIYHFYWALFFLSRAFQNTRLAAWLFEWRWVPLFIGGLIILYGYLAQFLIFLRPAIQRLTIMRLILNFCTIWVVFFALLQIPILAPRAADGALQMVRFIIAGHISIGLMSLLVCSFCFLYYFASNSKYRGFALSIALISGGCVFYRVHWAVQTWHFGISDLDVYEPLLNYPLYLATLLMMTSLGFMLQLYHARKLVDRR